MHYMKVRFAIALVLLLAVAGAASVPAARTNINTPDLPSPVCDNLTLPSGTKLVSRVYARGVQIYRWSGLAWDFVGPLALLFADANYEGQVGHHYATPNGPAWESNSGSKVIATRQAGCIPDMSAIPWLLLRAVSTTGPGIFSAVTHIHRVNTTGGVAPSTGGTMVGEVVEVPYTTEYYFYRAED